MKFTVIGGNGFIGSKIVQLLEGAGESVWVPSRNDESLFRKPLGVVVYCAGHGDCSTGMYKVLESNTVLLSRILEHSNFDKIIYLSSTRLYLNQDESSEESNITISNKDSRRLFNLTKALSEELIMRSGKKYAIIRPSNTYGVALKSPLFLPTIVRNSIDLGVVNMYVTPEYSKDYVSVEDVAEVTISIAKDNTLNNQIFNVASGFNTKARDIINILVKETNCDVVWHDNVSSESFPETDISKVSTHYKFKPKKVLNDLQEMIREYKEITK